MENAQTAWTPRLAAMIVVLNLMDALFTIVYTQAGLATEANPLMGHVLGSSPVLFMATKLALVSLSVLLLFRLQQHRAARLGLAGVFTAYIALLGYHLSAVERLAAVT